MIGYEYEEVSYRPEIWEDLLHPEDKEPVNIYKGPYGDYIKHNKVNVGLPEGETVESITLETAIALLADKAASKKTKGKTTRKKTTTKKTTTRKKTTAKKSTK